jgi:hypothetical protein
MITRFKRSYQKGYYKFLNEFHHNQELENTTKQQKKNTQTFINQIRKLINDINYCVVKNLKKKCYPIVNDKFEISKNTANFLINNYKIKGRFKTCNSFFESHKIVSCIFVNEKNYTRVDSIRVKIFKKKCLEYVNENNITSYTKEKYFFCIEFKKRDLVN